MTQPLAVGFSGKFGSGKTTLSRAFASSNKAVWVGFGDFIRAQARARQLDDQSGRVLQDLGQQLIDTRGSEWLVNQIVAPWLAGTRDGPLAIDGIRHLSVLNDLKRVVEPTRTKLVFIDGATKNPRQTIDDRQSDHPTELDVVSGLREAADLIIPSTMTMDDALARLNDAYERWRTDSSREHFVAN